MASKKIKLVAMLEDDRQPFSQSHWIWLAMLKIISLQPVVPRRPYFGSVNKEVGG